MNPDDQLLNDELSRDEGRRAVPYIDTVGKQTVGIGHNMDAHPIPADWTLPLSDEHIDLLYSWDMESVFNDLDKAFPWWRKMTYPRQRVLANMCFNMGLPVLSQFVNTLAAMEQGRYTAAASGMMASKWAKQVGKRADRLAEMMENG